jgi:hypothetical protein
MLLTTQDCFYASLDEALVGIEIPEDIRRTLALVDVDYLSFDDELHSGQLVVHQGLVTDVQEIFCELLRMRFPVEKAVPAVAYGWDDEAIMADNSSSAFNYRLILGTDRLSNHSYGTALDLNPMQNPYFARDGKVYPEGATYDANHQGTILIAGPVVALFKRFGWKWGGDWTVPIDYQHFEKPL